MITISLHEWREPHPGSQTIKRFAQVVLRSPDGEKHFLNLGVVEGTGTDGGFYLARTDRTTSDGDICWRIDFVRETADEALQDVLPRLAPNNVSPEVKAWLEAHNYELSFQKAPA